MKTLRRFFLALIFLIVASRAQAQLDLTQAEWDARGGRPTEEFDDNSIPDGKYRVYRIDGYEVSVEFVSGKAGYLSMYKLNKADFTAGEINSILQANQGDAQWKPVTNFLAAAEGDKAEQSWNRSDGWYAVYGYDESDKHRYLSIRTRWYYVLKHGSKHGSK